MRNEKTPLPKDPRWQRKRLEILNRDEFACRICGDTEMELHVHHLVYTRGHKPWEYENKHLLSVCKQCHGYIEQIKTDISAKLNFEPRLRLFNDLLGIFDLPDNQWLSLCTIMRAFVVDPTKIDAAAELLLPTVQLERALQQTQEG